MARSIDRCPSCRRARRPWSFRALTRYGRANRSGLQQLWRFSLLASLALGALVLAYYLSPLLLLFPLAALSAPRPASRGGRTVVCGRRNAASRS